METRSLRDEPEDLSLGQELVREYVAATAEEMGLELTDLIPVIKDYHDFPAPYWPGGDFLFALIEGELAGCVGITPGAEGLCEMNRLWVRPGYRGRKVGQALIRKSVERAHALGFSKMGLDVIPSRVQAIAMYETFGFEQCDPFHDYDFEVLGLERSVLKGR